MSAFFIRDCSSSPSWGYMLMPILAVTRHSSPRRTTGSLVVLIIFWAMVAALLKSLISSISIMNSSPPRRPTTSSARSIFLNRRAISCSNWSPASCPRESLIVLKRSKSINKTANRRWWRRADWMAWLSNWLNIKRLGNPVRTSWVAIRLSSCSIRLRSVMSRTMPNISRRSPESKTTSRTSIGKIVPSFRLWIPSKLTGSPGTICIHFSLCLPGTALVSISCIDKSNNSSRVYPRLSQASWFTSIIFPSKSWRKMVSFEYSTKRRSLSSLSCSDLNAASLCNSAFLRSVISIKLPSVARSPLYMMGVIVSKSHITSCFLLKNLYS